MEFFQGQVGGLEGFALGAEGFVAQTRSALVTALVARIAALTALAIAGVTAGRRRSARS